METIEQDLTYGGDRLQLFNIQNPLVIPISEFEIKWKTVDNVWVQFGTTKILKKDPNRWTKSYDCQFKKRHALSLKDPQLPIEKQWKTSQRNSSLCDAQITITLKNEIITIHKTNPDGPDHTHDLKASDSQKAPSTIISFIKDEAKKRYQAPAIKEAAQEKFKNEEIGIKYLPLKTVLNTQQKVHGGLNVPFIGAVNLIEDLKESQDWLKLNAYQVESFEETGYNGFAFATKENLLALQESGHLTIIDSTHKTNKHSWKLYTLLVRNSFGSWLSGGHFFVNAEEQKIVTKGLLILKRWTSNWKPRYFLIDQSAIEENAIKRTFWGLIAGE